MAHSGKDTTVVQSGSSGAAWFLVGALLVIVVGGFDWYYSGQADSSDLSINVDLPAVESN